MGYMTTDTIIDICRRKGAAFGASATLNLTTGDDTLDAVQEPLTDNGMTYTAFETGDTPVILYSRNTSFNGVGFNAYIFRDPIYTGGTQITDIRNSNDIAPQITTVTITAGILAANITNIGVGTSMDEFVFSNESNQGAGARLETIEDPITIPPNKKYMLVFKNRDLQGVQVLGSHLRWCEPERIPNIALDENGDFFRYVGLDLLI